MNGTLTVIARLKAKAGMEDRVAQELQKLLALTRVERGCINYDMHRSRTDPTLFLFHENWTSEADLDTHLQSPHIQNWIRLADTLLAEPIEITRWTRVG